MLLVCASLAQYLKRSSFYISVQAFYRLFMYVLPLEVQLSSGEG